MPHEKWPSISLCIIAKNEEQYLAQCLDSVKELVSEIILVDTGSQDRTLEIAKQYGAGIFFEAWQDDFSTPRNISLRHATGSWILVLDADEAIDLSDHNRIRELTLDSSACYLLTQRHYTNNPRLSGFVPVKGEFPNWEKDYGGYFESSCVRLFPNHHGIEYRNRIHELVEPCIEELKRHRIELSGVRIHHYGHTRSRPQANNKASLYTALGTRKLSDQPENWKAFYELAVEHQVNGRHSEAIQGFLKSIELLPRYLPSWINLGYVLGETGRYKEAEEALKTALRIDARAHEAFCNLGVVYLRTQNCRRAADCFAKAINLNPDYVNAYCNLGEAFIMLGNFEQAFITFQKALELFPQCAKAKEGLGTTYLMIGKLEEAEKLLKDSSREGPQLWRSHYWLSQLYRLTDRLKEAVSEIDKLCEAGNSSDAKIDRRALAACRRESLELKKLL